MPSLGELFIELGVVGDIKPLENAAKAARKAEKAFQDVINTAKEQIEYDTELTKVTLGLTAAQKKLNEAKTEEEKATAQTIIDSLNNRKAKLEEIKVAREKLRAARAETQAAEEQVKQKKALVANIGKAVKRIGVFVGALVGAGLALNKFTNELVQSNQAMLNLTRTSDISLNTFQKWNGIGKMLGVQDAAQQLEGLNQRLFELRLTGQGARGFQLAGINPAGQDAEGVLEQLRSRIEGMDDTSAAYLLREMGLDPQMLHILRLGREEFEALGQTIKKYQLTDKQRADIQKMNIQLEIARQQLQYLKDRAILAIMPLWVGFVKRVTNVITALAKLGKMAKKGADFLANCTIGTIRLGTAIKTVLIPALVALGMVFAPVQTAIGLFITGLALIADDIAHYVNGGDSLIGTFINFFDELDERINFETPKWIQDLLAIVQNAGNLFGTIDAIKNAKEGKSQNVQSAKIVRNALPLVPGLGWTAPLVWGSIAVEQLRDASKFGISKGWVKPPENLSMLTPNSLKSINNNSYDNSRTANNTTTQNVTQNIQIATNQPAYDIERELRFTTVQFA